MEAMYLIVDKQTSNVMGEHDTYPEAKDHFLKLVAAHPPVAPDLVILGKSGEVRPVPAEEVEAATATQDGPTHALAG